MDLFINLLLILSNGHLIFGRWHPDAIQQESRRSPIMNYDVSGREESAFRANLSAYLDAQIPTFSFVNLENVQASQTSPNLGIDNMFTKTTVYCLLNKK